MRKRPITLFIACFCAPERPTSQRGRPFQLLQGALSVPGKLSEKRAAPWALTPNWACFGLRLCKTTPSVTVCPTRKARGGWPSSAIRALPWPEAPATTPQSSKREDWAMLTSGAGACTPHARARYTEGCKADAAVAWPALCTKGTPNTALPDGKFNTQNTALAAAAHQSKAAQTPGQSLALYGAGVI
jgi:hypothetical protein